MDFLKFNSKLCMLCVVCLCVKQRKPISAFNFGVFFHSCYKVMTSNPTGKMQSCATLRYHSKLNPFEFANWRWNDVVRPSNHRLHDLRSALPNCFGSYICELLRSSISRVLGIWTIKIHCVLMRFYDEIESGWI